MDKYEVMMYPRAVRDMDDIYSYLAYELLSPENATGQIDRIWSAIRSLETFPDAHQDRLVGRYAGKGYKQLLIDNYLVIFKTDKKTRKVYVITVQYQGKDI